MTKILELSTENEEQLCEVGKALSSPIRIQILKLLYYNSFNIGEIAEKLQIPASSAAMHIRNLEGAGLINTELQPGNRGSMKLCSRKRDMLYIRLTGEPQNINQMKSISMPIGAYTDCSVIPTCGLASEKTIIGFEDKPSEFFLPERVDAQLLWSSGGYVEYTFPYPLEEKAIPKRLIASFEICSEAPNYQEDWKSDITIWINDMECATWQSPGDFGKRRGRLNPSWWDNGSTQYGRLLTIEVSEENTVLNNQPVSDLNIAELQLPGKDFIKIRIGNKEDAAYRGGFNLFGEKFGDYEQNLLLSLVY